MNINEIHEFRKLKEGKKKERDMRAIYDEKWGDRFLVHYFDYVPSRFKNVSLPLESARTAIWDFKDGKHQSGVALHTAKLIKSIFGTKGAKEITFICIPASSPEKNEIRYKEFSKLVCAMSGATNAYYHITVTGDRIAVHEQGRSKRITSAQVIEFDEEFFQGRKCLLFDDVVTSGRSLATFTTKLESMGAEVVGAFCMGKTLTSPNHPTNEN